MEYEGGRPPELYDIVDDPRQQKNLMGFPESARLLAEMKELLGEFTKRGKP